MIVARLLPGQLVEITDGVGAGWIFVAQTEHPIWPNLRLVVWRLADGSWCHDALDPLQHVGTALPSTPEDRQANLRRALLHESQW